MSLTINTKSARKSTVTKVEKNQSAATKVIVQDLLNIEDEFQGLYMSKSGGATQVLEPPYNPATLFALTHRNNILLQCVAAMETNVDGTGFGIEATDPEVTDETEEDIAKAFFEQPYPGKSMTSIRRSLRVDLESIGYAFLEVIRNANGDIMFLREMEATSMRLLKLDQPVPVEKELTRGGKTVKATMLVRERRFVQKYGTTFLYFKEFGSTRVLNRESGVWDDAKGTVTDQGKQATEIIYFTVGKDPRTPYGVPRWINQLPSIVGSRKAEEFNLDFFDAGGLPPAIVFVQGGTMADDVKTQLTSYMAGKGGGKHRGAVVEVQSSSGSIDSAGSVQVKVERFGSERTSDAMFQKYDVACEEHVRVAFRLPGIFVGRSQDYNFATAKTAYMVAEAQVFLPERDEFDEIINMAIMPKIGVTKYKYKSLPMTMVDVELQLKGVEMVKDSIDGEEKVSVVNETVGLSLEYSKKAEDAATAAKEKALNNQAAGLQGGQGAPKPAQGENGKPLPREPESPMEKTVQKLARLVDSRLQVLEGGEEVTYVLKEEAELTDRERTLFDQMLSLRMFGTSTMGDVAACCIEH